MRHHEDANCGFSFVFVFFRVAGIRHDVHERLFGFPCNEVWSGVKDTLSNPGNYAVKENDDAKMHGSCEVKHWAYINISGAPLQRTNKVTLLPKGTGCEMQAVSNYSGSEQNDQSD